MAKNLLRENITTLNVAVTDQIYNVSLNKENMLLLHGALYSILSEVHYIFTMDYFYLWMRCRSISSIYQAWISGINFVSFSSCTCQNFIHTPN